jgi:hypothetical protein
VGGTAKSNITQHHLRASLVMLAIMMLEVHSYLALCRHHAEGSGGGLQERGDEQQQKLSTVCRHVMST